jgi:hypothetical protein
MKKQRNKRFLEFVDTLDHIEVCRITLSPDGEFSVPSEREGRIAQVSSASRKSLAKFCRSFADRLEHKPKKSKRG